MGGGRKNKNLHLAVCGKKYLKKDQKRISWSEIKFLKTKEFWISAFDSEANKDFTEHDWKGRNVLLFGSEGYGLKKQTLKHSDFQFKVEINKSIESLNISNTVSIVCHYINNKIKWKTTKFSYIFLVYYPNYIFSLLLKNYF